MGCNAHPLHCERPDRVRPQLVEKERERSLKDEGGGSRVKFNSELLYNSLEPDR